MTRICRKNGVLPAEWTSFFPESRRLCVPLTIRSRINRRTGCCLAMVDLRVLTSMLDSAIHRGMLLEFLASREQKQFAGYRYAKRRQEWLGGRLACKQSIQGLLMSAPPAAAMTILPDKHGRPQLTMPGKGVLPAISISHSGRFAVAMACRAESCGIDIQEITPQIIRLADRIGDARELAMLAGIPASHDEGTRLTMLWAAKEAAKKSVLHDQPALFTGIRLQEFCFPESSAGNVFTCTLDSNPTRKVDIKVHILADYILATTLEPAYARTA